MRKRSRSPEPAASFLRNLDTWTCRAFPAVKGGWSPHKASVSREVGTTRFAPNSSTATRTRSRSPLNAAELPVITGYFERA